MDYIVFIVETKSDVFIFHFTEGAHKRMHDMLNDYNIRHVMIPRDKYKSSMVRLFKEGKEIKDSI